jgi:tetratricopeptide (TPR) repeat protein
MAEIWLDFYLPRIIYVLAGVCLAYGLYLHQRDHDFAARLRRLGDSVVRAAKDGVFRLAELADAESRLATIPEPDRRSFVITPYFEIYFAQSPKFALCSFVVGAALLYLALFYDPGLDYWSWFAWFGAGLLGLTGCLHWGTSRLRGSFEHVWQLNRKYLMLKAAGEAELDASLEIHSLITEYYPDRPELRLEKAVRLAAAGRLDAAVSEIGKARSLRPGEINYAFIEASFLIRGGKSGEARELLARIERDFRMAATDPRAVIYSAALAWRENGKAAAREGLRKALELDAGFTRQFLEADPTLADLRDVLMRDAG